MDLNRTAPPTSNSSRPGTPADAAHRSGAPAVGSSTPIQHSKPGIGRTTAPRSEGGVAAAIQIAEEGRRLPVVESIGSPSMGAKITSFTKERRPEEVWVRTPNITGSGASHVKTFHCKLTDDAIAYMDHAINEWLDAHPQYEVKFVSSSIGIMTGKLKEPALFCQVWV